MSPRRYKRDRAEEPVVILRPSELRTILNVWGLRDWRADGAVRLAAHLASVQTRDGYAPKPLTRKAAVSVPDSTEGERAR